MDSDTYISKGLGLIKDYIANDNLPAALKACQELYAINPYHDGVRSMYKKVQALVLEDNAKRVDQDIASTMHLWDEKKYGELLEIYKKLFAFAPNHEHLKEMIKKLNAEMQLEQERQRLSFIERAVHAIDEFIIQQRFRDAVAGARELLTLAPLNSTAKALLKRATRALVEDELEKNQRVIEGGDFQRTVEFLRELLALDPENSTLIGLQKKALAHLHEQDKISGKISVNESELRLKELFEKAEYEKVIQACDEIMLEDPHNVAAKIYRLKTERNLEIESERIVLRKMKSKEYRENLLGEYKKKPAAFLRV